MATIGVPSFADRSILNSTGPPEPAIYLVARACHRAAPSSPTPAVRPEMPVCGLPMQFLGLDARLPELTARTAQAARFDRTQYAGLEHARSGRSIREGQRRGVHIFRTVAQSMNSQRCARNGYRGIYTCLRGGGGNFPRDQCLVTGVQPENG